MTQEKFNRMLMAALREPKIEAAVIRIINEYTAKGMRRMSERAFARAARVTPQGSLTRKNAIRAVVPKK